MSCPKSEADSIDSRLSGAHAAALIGFANSWLFVPPPRRLGTCGGGSDDRVDAATDDDAKPHSLEVRSLRPPSLEALASPEGENGGPCLSCVWSLDCVGVGVDPGESGVKGSAAASFESMDNADTDVTCRSKIWGWGFVI
jgi:hypothetical protein